MPKLTMKLEGLSSALTGLKVFPETMNSGFTQSLDNWGNDVLNRSRFLVPYVTGALRSSGKITDPEFKDGVISLNIGYGDSKAWYATIVHERLDVRHPTGQAKYLEQPINENLNRLDTSMASALDSALRESFSWKSDRPD